MRSVTIRTRASGMCSRIHFVSQTMVRLLPEPWACQMIPPSRRSTNGWAAFTPKYWCGRQTFLTPRSKTMKSWISSRSRSFAQSWRSCPVERVLDVAWLLPGQVVLLGRPDHAVAKSLGVVAGHDQLDGREEGLDELALLAVDVLADPLGDRHGRTLELDDREGDPVDVEDEVRALPVRAKVVAATVTSSATAKWLRFGCSQSMSQTVSTSPSAPHLYAVSQHP